MTTPLAPGATVGILGGGQLGRMMAVAAAELGLRCHVFCPDEHSPAFDVSAARTVADYEDEAALAAFAHAVDVVTYEFENVPATTARTLAADVPVRPGLAALETAQDRLTEKRFLDRLGLPLAAFHAVGSRGELDAALRALGGQGVLKTRRFGYDGKGQVMIRSDDDLPAASALVDGDTPLVIEALVPFHHEVSVIAARGVGGDIAVYEIGDNTHDNHILRTTRLPSSLGLEARKAGIAAVSRILLELDYVGVIGVEFFVVVEDGREQLLVNEFAPRVHNSGHWTQDAAVTSQFEQHIRAVCGWPLGDPARTADVTMENLIGEDVVGAPELLRHPDAKLHLYGKREVRSGRKMGHVNWLQGTGRPDTPGVGA